MLIYQIYKLYYLLVVRSNEVLPDFNFELPNYHTTFVNITQNLGYFLDLTALTTVFTLWISYILLRLAVSFIRIRKL